MIEVVCEIGINHSGDLGIVKKLIDVASSAGIPFVKFQKRNIDLVYSKEELEKYRESPWGTTVRDQKTGLEFNHLDYIQIDSYCKEKNIKWFASAWDVESAFFLGDFDVPFMKIPSALITNFELLDICKQIGKPIILSTGMSTLEMVDKAVDVIDKDQIYCIMACTSTYPSKLEEINLRCIQTYKERYPWTKIGYSNHFPGLPPIIGAVVLGAEMIEFHITLSRASYGSDQAASIEPEGIFKIMKYINGIQLAMGDGVKKIYETEIPIIVKLRR